VDNVRIVDIDTYETDLMDSNVVFIGDSITAADGYKGWAGELEEHYGINRYNYGVGGMTSGGGLASGAYAAMRSLTGGITITF
jgi:hypothetical protein